MASKVTTRTLFGLGLSWAVLALPAAGPGAARAQHDSATLATLEAAARAAPGDAEAQIRFGRALLHAGDIKRAGAQMERAQKLAKDSPETLFEVARVRFAEGDYRRSRAACHALGQGDPGHVLHDVCMARAFLVWRRASRAEEPIAAALAKAPDNVEVQFAVAEAARFQSDFDRSEAAYRKVLARDPGYAEAYLGLSKLQSLKGQTTAAEATLRAGVKVHPDHPELRYELGLLAPPREAVDHLRAALSARPRWPEAEEALGGALLAAGDTQAAIDQLRAVLKRSPKDGIAQGRLGMAQLTLGQLEAAEQSLTKALALQPNHPDAALALARIYAQTDRLEDAFDAFRTAAGMRLTDSLPLIEAAALAHAKGRHVLANAFLERALERHPNDPRALSLRGDVLSARGDKQGAAEHYKRALAQPALASKPFEPGFDRAATKKKLEAL